MATVVQIDEHGWVITMLPTISIGSDYANDGLATMAANLCPWLETVFVFVSNEGCCCFVKIVVKSLALALLIDLGDASEREQCEE